MLDKFGDNGITGVYIVEKNKNFWVLDTFLLSCRIMGRGIEDAILIEIVKKAKENGIDELRANFNPTEKNKPSENFLSDFGFKKNDEQWIYDLNNETKISNHLEVEIEK